jgi:hypothetical protein
MFKTGVKPLKLTNFDSNTTWVPVIQSFWYHQVSQFRRVRIEKVEKYGLSYWPVLFNVS